MGPAGQSGTVKAEVGSRMHTFAIQQCLIPLIGPVNICSSSPPVTYVLPIGTATSWSVSPSDRFEKVSFTANTCTVKALKNDGYSGAVVAITAGGGIPQTIYATCSKGGSEEEIKLDDYVKAFPNPVSGMLNVEIDDTAHTLDLQSKNIAKAPTYEVCLLDNQAVARHKTFMQGGTVKFDISNLPNGIYYLLVHDGFSAPLLRQIVVEH